MSSLPYSADSSPAVEHGEGPSRLSREDKRMNNRATNEVLGRAEGLCQSRGVRLTAQRRRVLEILCASVRPLGAYEILDACAKDPARSRRRPCTAHWIFCSSKAWCTSSRACTPSWAATIRSTRTQVSSSFATPARSHRDRGRGNRAQPRLRGGRDRVSPPASGCRGHRNLCGLYREERHMKQARLAIGPGHPVLRLFAVSGRPIQAVRRRTGTPSATSSLLPRGSAKARCQCHCRARSADCSIRRTAFDRNLRPRHLIPKPDQTRGPS
jgi:hypothetical protein